MDSIESDNKITYVGPEPWIRIESDNKITYVGPEPWIPVPPPRSPRSSSEALTFEVQKERINRLETTVYNTTKEIKRMDHTLSVDREYILELMNKLRHAHTIIDNLSDRVKALEEK